MDLKINDAMQMGQVVTGHNCGLCSRLLPCRFTEMQELVALVCKHSSVRTCCFCFAVHCLARHEILQPLPWVVVFSKA